MRILNNRSFDYASLAQDDGVGGFTLVELLVTISILATLMAVLLPNLMGSRQRARDSKRIQELGMVKNALRMYYNDNQVYPGVADGVADTNLSDVLLDYVPGIAGVGYTYYRTNSGDGFNLCAYLEQGAGDSDVESQIGCGVNVGVGGSVCNLGAGVTSDGLFVVCTN